jgi:hypothetical protein
MKNVMAQHDRIAKVVWWLFVATAFAICASLSFLWRTEASIFIIIMLCPPIGLAIVAAAFALAARQKALWPWHGAAGVALIALGLTIGLTTDSLARRWAFEIRYGRYWELPDWIDNGRIANGPLPPDTARYFGIYSGTYYRDKGIVELNTISGPTLETTIYSRKPVSDPNLVPIKKAVGYFYFRTTRARQKG